MGNPVGQPVGRGDFFGVGALVTQMPRKESIQASTDCELLLVPRESLWTLKRTIEEFRHTSAWRELQASVVALLLTKVNFFKSLVASRRQVGHV